MLLNRDFRGVTIKILRNFMVCLSILNISLIVTKQILNPQFLVVTALGFSLFLMPRLNVKIFALVLFCWNLSLIFFLIQNFTL